MVRYEAVCELYCQQIIVIYINILPSKKMCGYFQSKKYMFQAKNKFDYSLARQ